ncbi:acetyl-CoA carboxylase biotin carboxyl carrier protein [Sporosarcina sp. YIM B06819]|uniref:acetyl-CoA carboxylase biotin carboxyl carrier protein n=1 Tax=Sporosarcina sp. YIM B06819 TaxID=3081769 RepID=UPI00298C394F|nr:acetyl-CoA carboxylase biotin carboxyl carrier protein [Sporosarcina sp. YIM B06819]
MLKIQEIREIIKLIDQSSIEKFTFESNGEKIKLEKGNGQSVGTPAVVSAPIVQQEVAVAQPVAVETVAVPVQQAPVAISQVEDSSLHKVTSPMVGTFYASSSPDEPAYVQNGDKVKPESIVCIVEAMKLFNEIEAEVSGEIVEILVKDGQLVEYGQPLFLVKSN